MPRADAYTLLIASLPHPGPLFSARQTPISRLQLDQRLTLLEPRDAATLARIEDLLQWGRLSLAQTDEDIIRRADTVVTELDSAVLREIVTWRLTLRTIVAALRRRQRGEPAPVPGVRWGYGPWLDYIRVHWDEPQFRLDGVFPWLAEVRQLLATGDTPGLERALLGIHWTFLSRVNAEHHFDFEAVVLYVLRWNIVARWSLYNGEAATRRFDRLVEAGLGDYARLF